MPFDQATPRTFTSEQVQKFKKGMENRYDIFVGHDFVSWLCAYSYLPKELKRGKGKRRK